MSSSVITCNVFADPLSFYGALADIGSKRARVHDVADAASMVLSRAELLTGWDALKKASFTAKALASLLEWKPLKKTTTKAKEDFHRRCDVESKKLVPAYLTLLLSKVVPEHSWQKYGAFKVAKIWGVVVVCCPVYDAPAGDDKLTDVYLAWGDLSEEGKSVVTNYVVNTFGKVVKIEPTGADEPYRVGPVSLRIESVPVEKYVAPDGSYPIVSAVKKEIKLFQAAGVSRKVLLLGRPGCGKTALATHIAADGDGVCLVVPGNDTPTYIAGALAKGLKNATLVFDDVDRDGFSIKKFISADGPLQDGTCVVATANVLHTLDPAMMRPGRFDRVFTMETAGPSWMRRIVKSYADQFGMTLTDEEYNALSQTTPAEAKDVVNIMGIVGRDLMQQEIERVIAQRDFVDLSLIKQESLNKAVPTALKPSGF